MKGQGTVLSVDGIKAKVRVIVSSECMGCPSKSSCQPGAGETREITAINDCGAEVSDQVVFEADTGKVIISAALIWIVPLIAMIIGYIVGEIFAEGFWPIGVAFVFLVASFAFLSLLDKSISGGKKFYPKITKIVHSIDQEEYCKY